MRGHCDDDSVRGGREDLALASGVERYEVQHVLGLPAGTRRTMVAKRGWSTDALGFPPGFCPRSGSGGGCGSRWAYIPL